jgi:hypothetical protein
MRAKPVKQRRTTSQAETDNRRNMLIIAAAVLGVVALAFLLYLSVRDPSALAGLQRFTGLSRGHNEAEIPVSDLPPVGGTHSATWQNCGVYEQPVNPKHAIHSMEHGAVWITYQPGLTQDEVEQLQDLAWDQPYVLLSPYPGLRSPIVLNAWGIQLELDDAGDGRIANFVERYQVGPQTPELGATCQDGTGEPINS